MIRLEQVTKENLDAVPALKVKQIPTSIAAVLGNQAGKMNGLGKSR